MPLDIKESETNRFYPLLEFKDLYDKSCSIQESSLDGEETIWLGVNRAKPIMLANGKIEGAVGWVECPLPKGARIQSRMHLTREQVSRLIPILQRFADTGIVRL